VEIPALKGYPQVRKIFHRFSTTGLWTEKRLFCKALGRFYTFTQGLFLLLSINIVLKLYVLEKATSGMAIKLNLWSVSQKQTEKAIIEKTK
jgi:hypothetical protein